MKRCFTSDFADELIEEIKKDEFELETRKYKDINYSRVKIIKDNNEFNKKIGEYVSIEFLSCEDKKDRENIKDVLKECLIKMISKYNVREFAKVLVVGLGNREFSADSLGPMVANNIIVTNHLFVLEDFKDKVSSRSVSVLTPGVMGQTGLESADIVKSVCDFFKPELVIFIDSLATKSMKRINKVIQISDTGISPGSGIGNNRKSLDIDLLNVPCISIGVATVMGVDSIINESLDLLNKYLKNSISNKMILDKDNRYDIISDLLSDLGIDMVVTPKQINEDINNISSIISNAINESLHKNINYL